MATESKAGTGTIDLFIRRKLVNDLTTTIIIMFVNVLLAPHQAEGELFYVINRTDPGDCIAEGVLLTLACTVEDVEGTGATVWTGSDTIFDCPSANSIVDRQVYLIHREFRNPAPRFFCTDNTIGQIVEYNGTHYTSTLTVSTTRQMNDGLISCRSYYETEITGQVQISVGVVPAPPAQINVVFNDRAREFTLSWSMPDILGGVRNYLTEIAGSDCGTCNIVSSLKEPEMLCSDWIPNGQVCNVTVKTVSADCGFVSTVPATKQVHLKYPDAPVIKMVLPTYSIEKELESLSVIMMLTEGKFDANGLPITYGVYLEDVTSGNVCVQLASRECDVYNCEIKIVMSEDCLMKKESLFSIKVFAETLIGQLLSCPHLDLINSQNKFIELSMVVKDDFTLFVTEFTNTSFTLSTSVQYGLCHSNALNLQKQVSGANDSAICVVINDLPSREESCFIATCMTDNINYPISIRGELKDNTSVDLFAHITTAGVILALSIIFNFTILLGCLTLLVSRFKARVQFKAKVQSDIKEQSGSNTDPVYEVVLPTNDESAPVVVQTNLCYSTTTAL